MSITERALEAAGEAGRWEGEGGYVPPAEDRAWKAFETTARNALEDALGEDPGPAQRLEKGTKAYLAVASQYPAAVQKARILVFRPEGHEIVAVRDPRRGVRTYVVRRSANPNEEAMLAPFDDLEGFGRAIA